MDACQPYLKNRASQKALLCNEWPIEFSQLKLSSKSTGSSSRFGVCPLILQLTVTEDAS